MEPNKENMTKWVEALESGKFPQARQTYGVGRFDAKDDRSGFCCLHVALALATGTEDKESSAEGRLPHPSHGLMRPIRDWLGININQSHEFVRMNDEEGKTFPEIATYIRGTYL